MPAPQAPTPGEVPWQTICEQAPGPLAVLDLEGRAFYVNPALCRMLGYDREKLLGQPAREVTHPDDPVVDRDFIDSVVKGGSDSFEVEKRFLRSDGSAVWALVSSAIIRGARGDPYCFLSQIHDITARRESELLWRRTIANAPIGMALLDLKGHLTEVNDKWCELVGYSRDELLTMHFSDLTYADDRGAELKAFTDLIEGHQSTVTLEKRYRHKDGHPLWVLIHTSAVLGADDRPSYLVSQCEPIGGRRMEDRHLAHMALHDPLTGVANRALLFERLEQELAGLSDPGRMLAVLLVDLNKLKPVNDEYGHAVGDQLLITAADELLNSVRSGDTVARIGGDEFVVLTRMKSFSAAEEFRKRVAERLAGGVLVSGHNLDMSASVGLAVTQNSTTSAEALLHNADRDMYRHKRRT